MKRIYWFIFGLLAFTGTAQAAQVTTHHCTVIETTDFTPNLSSDSPVLGVVYSTEEYYGSTFNVYVDRYGGVAVNSECPSNSVSIPAGNYSLQAMHGGWSGKREVQNCGNDGGLCFGTSWVGNFMDVRMYKCGKDWHWTRASVNQLCVSPGGAISPGN